MNSLSAVRAAQVVMNEISDEADELINDAKTFGCTACGVSLCMIPCFNEYRTLKHVWFPFYLSCHKTFLLRTTIHCLFAELQLNALCARVSRKQSDRCWRLLSTTCNKNCCTDCSAWFSSQSFANVLAKRFSNRMCRLGSCVCRDAIRHSDGAEATKWH